MLLEELVRDRHDEIGRVPNIFPTEFDLAAGATRAIAADFKPDRWVLYARPNSGSLLRVFPGGAVPSATAYEFADGQRMVLSVRNLQIAIYNAGPLTAHVFCVALGGGCEFDVTGLPGLANITPALLTVTATGAASAQVILTLPAPAPGLYHYITRMIVQRFAVALLTAAAAPVIVATTNLPGTREFSIPAEAAPQGGIYSEIFEPCGPLKSSVAATASLLTAPATTNVIWRLTADYYTGP